MGAPAGSHGEEGEILPCILLIFDVPDAPTHPPLLAEKQVATVGVYGAKKVVAFAKAFVKARKEASEDSAGEGEASAVATNDGSGDKDEEGDEGEEAAEVRS